MCTLGSLGAQKATNGNPEMTEISERLGKHQFRLEGNI
jgi:hypothetical protein